MQTQVFKFDENSQWQNLEKAKALDSENTLVMVFCSPEFFNHPQIFKDLKEHFPQGTISGCSTSGEILNEHIFDHSLACVAIKFESSHFKLATKVIESQKQSFEIGKS